MGLSAVSMVASPVFAHGFQVGSDWVSGGAQLGEDPCRPHIFGFSFMGPTREAHVGWLNGPHLRSSLIPLRAPMGKDMGPTWVLCHSTKLGPT